MADPWKRKEVIGDATLYLGDCLEILPTLPKVDAVITDPPYGIAYESNHVCDTTTAGWMNQQIANDGDTSARDAVLQWHSGAWAVFASPKFPVSAAKEMLVWDKGPASGMGDLSFPWKRSYEFIFVGGRGWSGARDEGVIKGHWMVTRKSMGREHPNEKPVGLLRHLVLKAPGLICDPFMGSGTTGVACMNLGRKFIGIEIEERYFNIAVERITNAQRQQRMFA